ncbi:thiol reductant ABC exporter subunit CydC [Pseudoalteromonas sp. BDTF-M6]|uniref:thiol reductant ABC exporter subunit CydC n=1 Tax=Pseudoalteromonas sp. BDTF-M6 TaxID=2796132 RepID=UPI001BAF3B4E|nr:thiol reductant ABC exporter subunit CydC [Pseudoalteromonas sp. BDTF-M6]MBS3798666.1 thiol reductant ABC exporter subunit CydC [Pseudoalteromonas sp. BDTF-M6]
MANWCFLISLIRPHLGWALLGMLLAFLALAANITLLAVSAWFLAAMAAAGLHGVTMNYFTPAGIIRFLAIVRTASGYAQRLVNHNTTFLILKTLRVHIFAALTQVPQQCFASVGRRLSQLQEDVEQLDEFYIGVLVPLLLAVTALPLIAWALGVYSLVLMLVTVTALLTTGFLLPTWLGRNLKGVGKCTQEAQSDLSECLVEGTRGLKELYLAGATEQYWRRLDTAQQALAEEQQKAHRWFAGHQGLSLFISQLTLVLALLTLIPLVNNGQLANVELAMLVLLVLGAFESVLMLPDAMLKMELTLASAGRIRALLAEVEHTPTPGLQGEKQASSVFSLDQVHFAYRAQQPVFHALSLDIKRGEKVAIVGRSGAGKSTLLGLLTAQLHAQQGKTLASGIPIDALDPAWLNQQLGVLNQYSHTFSATIRENLLLAKEDASDDEIWSALEQAQLTATVKQMTKRLDTQVGATGRQLSAGEARRLHLAQLFLRDPQVLLLDEPTRGLDGDNQRKVFAGVLALAESRTLVVSTHEAALLGQMDKVIWMEQGRIKAMASHEALTRQYPEYHTLTHLLN